MHQQKADKVYDEICAIPHTDRKALQKCPYLDAFLMEVLRLHPVVLTGGLRDTPSQGMMIGKEHIPGNVTVQVPRFSIAQCKICQDRSPIAWLTSLLTPVPAKECFVRPTEFIPERWTSENHLVLDKRGHLPFGQGM